MTESPPWVPFSHRYGLAGPSELHRWVTAGGESADAERWRARHHPVRDSFARVEESGVFVDPVFRCTCPGAGGLVRCADRASQEDRLCDPCRGHCWGVTDTGTHRRLVDVYGAMIAEAADASPSWTCPACGATSWNPNDVRERYCGRCHGWTGVEHKEAIHR